MGTLKNKDHLQLQYIQDFLIQIAKGDYKSKLSITNEKDEQLVAIQVGINMLVEELKETSNSELFLNSIYNGINDILFVLNEKVEIKKTNQVAEKLLLYSQSELLNQSIGKLIHKNDFDKVRDALRNTYHEKKLHEISFNFITKDNNLIPVSCSFSPLFNNKGRPIGILLIAKNISTLNNTKKQLQDKNDELNLFVYKASHDLKSPVSSMKAVMTLLGESQDIDEMKMYCKMIEECTSRLDTIISDLLVLGRITYGELEYGQINIKHTIDDILKSIQFVDGFKDVNFNIDIDDNAQSIITEKGLLRTILYNLIDNAIKYRKNRVVPSYINIQISNKKKGVIIKIEENGIGIADSHQANIFKMFYRATSKSKGSGLGLYIVKTSVLKLGGTISLESTFGKGSIFKINIPQVKV